MGHQRTVELTEQLELVPSEPKTKERPVREDYVLATLYAEHVVPQDADDRQRKLDGAVKMALKHFSDLCGNGAKRKGYKVYTYAEVYLAWEALYEKYLDEKEVPGLWKQPPTLLGVAYGSNPWIETWRKDIMNNIPPVYYSYDHDSYVRKHAHVLRAFGFHYGATDQPNRLPFEEVKELGLL